jgi:predicted P-loop ATPase
MSDPKQGNGGGNIINLPLPSSSVKSEAEHAREETASKAAWFEWAKGVLAKLGYTRRFRAARTLEELNDISFDKDSIDVMAAIHDALHPVSGSRAKYFVGENEARLKRILMNQFDELKMDAHKKLKGRAPPDWRDKLTKNANGSIRSQITNYATILQHSPKWKGVIAFDKFAQQVVIRRPPPWGGPAADAPWTDDHETQTRIYFQRQYGLNPGLGDTGRAVLRAAHENEFHPLVDRLESLTWDQTVRTPTWLPRYCGAPDTPYVCAIGQRWLISAVARAYQPGCQADHMLVFEGPQGLLKSTLLRTLAMRPEWYAHRISALGSKDSQIEVRGVWIFELAELEALRRAASGTSKSFLTALDDRYRPPWGTNTIRVPRGCVFGGSINPPADGRYLPDSTGNRRLWPFPCQVIDIDGFTQVRDQLWAEAVRLYKAGAPWWLDTDELVKLATAEQARRLIVHAWHDPISRWLAGRDDTSVQEVLTNVLNEDPKNPPLKPASPTS